MKTKTSLEDIIALAKRRGFIFQNSSIYGGLANSYDFGPLGVELKNNIKNTWWKMFVHNREDIIGLDGNIIMSPKVWDTSGHTKEFKDPLVECKKCHHRFRPDKLKDASRCPDCGGSFTKEKFFSGMFKTVIGPVEEEGLTTYLRPETAQAIFINFKNVLDSSTKKIPFGIAQIGKAFRNEITTGPYIFRTYEFEQMEIEYFISPQENWEKIFDKFLDQMHKYGEKIGLDKKKYYDHLIPQKERAHYSKKTIDIEYNWPFGRDELWGLAYRTDYDLKKHLEASGQDLEYLDPRNNQKYVPHVIEPSLGVDRTVLAVLLDSYFEEKLENGESRVVMKFKKEIAPYKVAIFPLLKNKSLLVKKAKDLFNNLKEEFICEFDDNGNIGKRYRRQDEIGTPYCVTIDFDSLEKNDVTVRDRDSMNQERVKIDRLKDYLDKKLK